MVTYAPHATGTVGLRRFLNQPSPAPQIHHVEQPEWMFQALCAETDPDVFFPDDGVGNQPAKRICDLCPVTAKCLAWALEIESHSSYCYGVYGGVSARGRRQMLRDLAAS